MSWNKLRAKKKTDGPPLPASFRGWPSTQLIEDPEHPTGIGVEIYAGCLSPAVARFADGASSMLSVAVGLDIVVLGLEVGTLEFFIPAMVGVAGVSFVIKRFLAWLFTRTLWIRMFEDRIEIAGWREFETYNTNVGYTFRLDDHEKALDEELQVRQNKPTGRYYTNSKRVLFDHGRQGVFLAEVYPKARAEALCNRLMAIQHGFAIGAFK